MIYMTVLIIFSVLSITIFGLMVLDLFNVQVVTNSFWSWLTAALVADGALIYMLLPLG